MCQQIVTDTTQQNIHTEIYDYHMFNIIVCHIINTIIIFKFHFYIIK